MKTSRGSNVLLGSVFAAVLFSATLLAAQQGDNAVYTLSNNVPTLAVSSAWIDASAFCGNNGSSGCGVPGSTDVCTMINRALSALPSIGGVIDARGVVPPPPNAQSQTCSGNPFPSTFSPNGPVTVLLPASTIAMAQPQQGIPGTWVLPNNVRLEGVGSETFLIDNGNCCSASGGMGGSMIQMGPPASGGVCPATIRYIR